MSLYGITKRIYTRILPKATRNVIYTATPTFLKVLRAKVIRLLEKSAYHDEIYDEEYYTNIVDPWMATSCDTIAESIVSMFSPKSAIDVGCGTGLLLLALKEGGVCCHGLECSEAAIDISRLRGLEVTKFDLEHDSLPSGYRADIAVSTEVAEHLPESCADRFVNTLCNIADNILITAAQPSPAYAGTDHVNEQPNEYWIAKFEARGFRYEKELTNELRANWKAQNVAAFFFENLMVFLRRGKSLRACSGDFS